MTELFIGYQPRHPGMRSWPDYMAFRAWLNPFAGWNPRLWQVAKPK